MQIKPNTEYRTRDGQKRGPLEWVTSAIAVGGNGYWRDGAGGVWDNAGRSYAREIFDLVSEWHEPQADAAQIDTDQLARLGAHVAEPVDPPKSLRDEFAMAVISGLASACNEKGEWTSVSNWAAAAAYEYADAMMAARRPANAMRAGEVDRG